MQQFCKYLDLTTEVMHRKGYKCETEFKSMCDPVERNESEVAHAEFLINTKLGQKAEIFEIVSSSF